jgi:SAM-dependent methyltransferase
MAEAQQQQRDTYVLQRDTMASARLTTQFYVMQGRIGWLLHPDIKAAVEAKDKVIVADVACGNGIWSIDLAAEYPQAQITAFDISTDLFPPSWTWPENVRFERQDIFDPVPEQYVNHFDVIHLSLIIGGIYDKDKNIVISHLLEMLRPGGYLQWQEALPPSFGKVDESLIIQSPRDPSKPLPESVKRMMAPVQWLHELPRVLEEHGLQHTKRFDPPIKPGRLKHETDSVMWTAREMSEATAARAHLLDEQARKNIESSGMQMVKAVSEGTLYCYTFLIVIGQKPL